MQYQENIRIQRNILVVAVVLFLVKIAAYVYTHSIAVLTDALESTINVATGIWGLYSIKLAATPRDKNHPYGHGKIEFVTATIEGMLIIVAGAVIIFESISRYSLAQMPHKLDLGIGLIAFTALVNYLMGHRAEMHGKKVNSLQLIASGKHLKSDTYTTIGILVGLVLIYFTRLPVLDVIVAIIFAFVLLYTGYKIIRESISGIMDEADMNLLNKAIAHFNQNRRENWVDLHNLRIIKYGNKLHFDCHLTVPWYFNVHQAHDETAALEQSIRDRFGDSIELFVHTDGCLDFSCKICTKTDCTKRLEPIRKKIEWTFENLSDNEKHGKYL